MIRLVLFDAFGTLCTPRTPIRHQYGALARDYGLQVQDEDLKKTLMPAFKHFDRRYPLYGKHNHPPLESPDAWWTLVIEKALADSGVADSDLQTTLPLLGPAIISHFGTKKAYRLCADAMDTLQALSELDKPPELGILTNSDSRIVDALRDLGLTRYIKHTFLSWDLGVAKPDPKAFLEAVRRSSLPNLQPSEVLHVGDDSVKDVEAARSIGMHALLVDGESDMRDRVLSLVGAQNSV